MSVDSAPAALVPGGVLATASISVTESSEDADMGGWVQCSAGSGNAASGAVYWVHAETGAISADMPSEVFEAEIRSFEGVAEQLEAVAVELAAVCDDASTGGRLAGAARGARDATGVLLAAMEAGDDAAARKAAGHVDGAMSSLEKEEAAARVAQLCDDDSMERLRGALARVRWRLKPLLTLARAGAMAQAAEVNMSPLANELRRRREQLRHVHRHTLAG